MDMAAQELTCRGEVDRRAWLGWAHQLAASLDWARQAM